MTENPYQSPQAERERRRWKAPPRWTYAAIFVAPFVAWAIVSLILAIMR